VRERLSDKGYEVREGDVRWRERERERESQREAKRQTTELEVVKHRSRSSEEEKLRNDGTKNSKRHEILKV
jgi:type IV secretory pathway TrbF-like protein